MGSRTTERPAPTSGHLCWIFDDDDDFRQTACAFLQAGHERNERLIYVADRSDTAALADDLSSLGDVEALTEGGALELHTTHALYEEEGVFEAEAQIERWRELTDAALSDGFSGIRVAADATDRVATEADRRAFQRYELMADRFMAAHPMVALCAYDRRVLGDAADDLAAVHAPHPARRDAGPGCFVYHDGERLHLEGFGDIANRPTFEAALDAAGTGAFDAPVVLDLSRVDFLDIEALTHLDRVAAGLSARGVLVTIAGASAIVQRCAELLGLVAIAGETTDDEGGA